MYHAQDTFPRCRTYLLLPRVVLIHLWGESPGLMASAAGLLPQTRHSENGGLLDNSAQSLFDIPTRNDTSTKYEQLPLT